MLVLVNDRSAFPTGCPAAVEHGAGHRPTAEETRCWTVTLLPASPPLPPTPCPVRRRSRKRAARSFPIRDERELVAAVWPPVKVVGQRIVQVGGAEDVDAYAWGLPGVWRSARRTVAREPARAWIRMDVHVREPVSAGSSWPDAKPRRDDHRIERLHGDGRTEYAGHCEVTVAVGDGPAMCRCRRSPSPARPTPG